MATILAPLEDEVEEEQLALLRLAPPTGTIATEKSCSGITAAASVVATPVSRSRGTIVILVIISIPLSLGLIWAINALARSKNWGMGGACFLAAGTTILPI